MYKYDNVFIYRRYIKGTNEKRQINAEIVNIKEQNEKNG